MVFCGVEKLSCIDYPGKISCVLFVPGCNFFCPYCHNPQVVRNKLPVSMLEHEALEFISERKDFYDAVVISGGEPTLYNGLPSLCSAIKKNTGCLVKIDTNGSRPDILKLLLENNLVDYIGMDIKTDLRSDSYKQFSPDPNIVSLIKNSISLVIEMAPDYDFRTTCVSPIINSDIIKNICKDIKGARLYCLQYYNTKSDSILNKDFFNGKDPSIPNREMERLVEDGKTILSSCCLRKPYE